jgi:hypothetical protein
MRKHCSNMASKKFVFLSFAFIFLLVYSSVAATYMLLITLLLHIVAVV